MIQTTCPDIQSDASGNLNGKISPKRPISILIMGGAFFLSVIFFTVASEKKIYSANSEKSNRPDALPSVLVSEPAWKGDLPLYLSGLGTVTSSHTVTVRSRIDGQLTEVLFKEGQTVNAGELLAKIDSRPFEVQLNQALGQMMRDRALLENATTDLKRYQTLWKQDSISKQQLDTQESLVLIAHWVGPR